jgi:hypothetical protein
MGRDFQLLINALTGEFKLLLGSGARMPLVLLETGCRTCSLMRPSAGDLRDSTP